MNKDKILKKIKNLEKVKGIVEIAKVDTMKKLANVSSITSHHYESAKLAQEIMTFATYKLHLKYNQKNLQKLPKLFIYISIPSNLIKMSHDQLNKILLKMFDPSKDKIVTIGKPAFEFAKQQNFQILKSYDELEKIYELISIINHAIAFQNYQEIQVIAMSQQFKNQALKIFPIIQQDKKQKIFDSSKFYYSLSENFENIANTYVVNTIKGIYNEAYKVFFKQKLLKHEEALKSIDEKAEFWKIAINKINRKIETEEMVRISATIKE